MTLAKRGGERFAWCLAISLLLHALLTVAPVHWNLPQPDARVAERTAILQRIALATPKPPPPRPVERTKRVNRPVHVNVVRVRSAPDAAPMEARPRAAEVEERAPAAGAVAGAPAGPAPTAAPVPPAVAPDQLRAWQAQISARLERLKEYPEAARDAGEQGVAYVRFRLDRAGNVLTVSLARSSGYDPLDDEVLALVRRAGPFPAPPPGVPDAQLDMIVPVAFALGDGA